MVKLYMYNDTYWRLVSFDEKILYKRNYKKSHRWGSDEVFTDKEEIERISLSRTKSNIKEICLSNEFEYFMTVTINSRFADRFSLQEVQDKMKKICHKIKRKNKDFKYIFITEKHKDGAFHFHGMCKNIDLYKNNNGYLSSFDFDNLGYNSFSKIKDYNACCSYITKYITKNCVKNENNQIYFCSRGLQRASVSLMIPIDLKEIFGDNVFQNDFCQCKDFDIEKLSRQQKIKLNEYFKESDEILQNDNNFITNWLHLLTNFKTNIIM